MMFFKKMVGYKYHGLEWKLEAHPVLPLPFALVSVNLKRQHMRENSNDNDSYSSSVNYSIRIHTWSKRTKESLHKKKYPGHCSRLPVHTTWKEIFRKKEARDMEMFGKKLKTNSHKYRAPWSEANTETFLRRSRKYYASITSEQPDCFM